MPSTSKSNRRKNKNFKFVPKLKQQWKMKQPTRNWLDLPTDVMANILSRVGAINILENAQKVCTTWRKICKDPAMWRVINLTKLSNSYGRFSYEGVLFEEMCKHAVDRSQGQLVDLTMVVIDDDELLLYVADRSSQLKRLEVACCDDYVCEMDDTWAEALKKFPLLEELNLYSIEIAKEGIETAGRCCPLLKTLKVNQEADRYSIGETDEYFLSSTTELAIAIGENLHELRHLELIGSSMSNVGLQAILDGCRHLESLDLRQCFNIDLKGDLGKRCFEQIKCVKLPKDSLEGCPYINEYNSKKRDVTTGPGFYSDGSDYEYDDYFDYDDFTAPLHYFGLYDGGDEDLY